MSSLRMSKQRLSTNPPNNIMVVFSVTEECKAVESSAVMKSCTGNLWPSPGSENMNSSYYGDREEVFGGAGQKLVVFPPTQADEVRGGQEEGHGEAQHDGRVKKKLEKKDKLEECSLGRCKRAASTNLCPGGVLDGNKRQLNL